MRRGLGVCLGTGPINPPLGGINWLSGLGGLRWIMRVDEARRTIRRVGDAILKNQGL